MASLTSLPQGERLAVLQDTAAALHVAQMEGLRERLDAVRSTTSPAAAVLPKHENPFTHQDRIDAWERFKIVLGVVLVPLRLLGALLCLLPALLILRLTLIGVDTKTKPLTGWRLWVQFVLNCTLLRFMLFFLGIVWISVKGKPAPRHQVRCVVVAPHSTFMDGFLAAYLLNMGSPVAKAEAAKGNCLMSSLVHAAQAILVDRHSQEGKRGAMEAIKARIASPDPSWRHVYIFPEGTCTNRKSLINFKAGAFAAGKPVQPLLLRWDGNTCFNPTWTSGGPNRLWLVYRFLCQFYVSVSVEFPPAYEPSQEEQANAALYANNVRKRMAQQLGGLPVTEHGYEDSFLAALAHKQRVDPELSLPHEFATLHQLFHITYPEANRLMRRYAQATKGKSGKKNGGGGGVDVEAFAKLLDLPLSEAVVDFFFYLDVTGDGLVDFPSFLIGLSFLSAQNNVEECAKVVWCALGMAQLDEKVELAQLKQALDLAFKRGGRARALPLLSELKKKDKDSTTLVGFDEFVGQLRLHPEYLPVALQYVQQQQQQASEPDSKKRGMSVGTAKTKLQQRQAQVPGGGGGGGAITVKLQDDEQEKQEEVSSLA